MKHLLNTGFLLLALSGTLHAADSNSISPEKNSGPIVVTIKPLYSLTAHLTAGVESPVLLMKQMQSPHHYNMKPSERRLLSDARMIIWLGPQMESFLYKIIQQQKSAVIVTALHAEKLKFLSLRRKFSNDGQNITSVKRPEPHHIDPHVWLSTSNTAAISRHIAAALIKNDPVNTGRYKENLQRLLQKIEQTKEFISRTLSDNTVNNTGSNKQPFIAFHDAFQYFEEENALNYIDSISFDDETGASLKHLRQIKSQIEKQNIQCLVYQAPKPAIVKSLTDNSSIRATALDPLGQNVSNNKNAWFEIMRAIALNFKRCLNS